MTGPDTHQPAEQPFTATTHTLAAAIPGQGKGNAAHLLLAGVRPDDVPVLSDLTPEGAH